MSQRSNERLGAFTYLERARYQKADPKYIYRPHLYITVGIDPQISVGPINRSERLINRASKASMVSCKSYLLGSEPEEWPRERRECGHNKVCQWCSGIGHRLDKI